MLSEKNKVMNLTAITEPSEIATLHFLDSACLLAEVDFRSKRVVDVGTGAGFPGLPLRILEPSIQLTLLDSLNKRIAFLKEVCAALALEDVACVHGGRRNLPPASGSSLTLPFPGPWPPCPFWRSFACPWSGPGGWFWP